MASIVRIYHDAWTSECKTHQLSIYTDIDVSLNTLELVHKMSVDITKLAVTVQNWFAKSGGCNIIDFTTVLECNKIIILNIISIIIIIIIINILNDTVFQLQGVLLKTNHKYIYFSL